MSQLVSVRSNQNFGLDYEKGKLIPQTEIIVVVQKPVYKVKGDSIIKTTGLDELRFEVGLVGLTALIGQLEAAQKACLHFEKMASVLNQVITKPEEDEKK